MGDTAVCPRKVTLLKEKIINVGRLLEQCKELKEENSELIRKNEGYTDNWNELSNQCLQLLAEKQNLGNTVEALKKEVKNCETKFSHSELQIVQLQQLVDVYKMEREEYGRDKVETLQRKLDKAINEHMALCENLKKPGFNFHSVSKSFASSFKNEIRKSQKGSKKRTTLPSPAWSTTSSWSESGFESMASSPRSVIEEDAVVDNCNQRGAIFEPVDCFSPKSVGKSFIDFGTQTEESCLSKLQVSDTIEPADEFRNEPEVIQVVESGQEEVVLFKEVLISESGSECQNPVGDSVVVAETLEIPTEVFQKPADVPSKNDSDSVGILNLMETAVENVSNDLKNQSEVPNKETEEFRNFLARGFEEKATETVENSKEVIRETETNEFQNQPQVSNKETEDFQDFLGQQFHKTDKISTEKIWDVSKVSVLVCEGEFTEPTDVEMAKIFESFRMPELLLPLQSPRKLKSDNSTVSLVKSGKESVMFKHFQLFMKMMKKRQKRRGVKPAKWIVEDVEKVEKIRRVSKRRVTVEKIKFVGEDFNEEKGGDFLRSSELNVVPKIGLATKPTDLCKPSAVESFEKNSDDNQNRSIIEKNLKETKESEGVSLKIPADEETSKNQPEFSKSEETTLLPIVRKSPRLAKKNVPSTKRKLSQLFDSPEENSDRPVSRKCLEKKLESPASPDPQIKESPLIASPHWAPDIYTFRKSEEAIIVPGHRKMHTVRKPVVLDEPAKNVPSKYSFNFDDRWEERVMMKLKPSVVSQRKIVLPVKEDIPLKCCEENPAPKTTGNVFTDIIANMEKPPVFCQNVVQKKKPKKKKKKKKTRESTLKENLVLPAPCFKTDSEESAWKSIELFLNAQNFSEDAAKNSLTKCVTDLKSIPDQILVKVLVKFVLENVDESPDLRFTPPAPPLTPMQHRLFALFAASDRFPTIFTEMIDELYAVLLPETFKWGDDTIESCAMFLGALYRHLDDYQGAVQFCVDIGAGMRQRGCLVINNVLAAWPEILPLAVAADEWGPGVTTAKLVMSMPLPTRENQQLSLRKLKNLLDSYYGYPREVNVGDWSKKAIQALRTGDLAAGRALRAISGICEPVSIVAPLMESLGLWEFAGIPDSVAFLMLDVLTTTLKKKDNKLKPLRKEVCERLGGFLVSPKVSHQGQEEIVKLIARVSNYANKFHELIAMWKPCLPISKDVKRAMMLANSRSKRKLIR